MAEKVRPYLTKGLNAMASRLRVKPSLSAFGKCTRPAPRRSESRAAYSLPNQLNRKPHDLRSHLVPAHEMRARFEIPRKVRLCKNLLMKELDSGRRFLFPS